MRRVASLLTIWVVVLVLVGSTHVSSAWAKDALVDFESPEARESDLRDALDAKLGDLVESEGLVAHSGLATLVSRASRNVRAARARRLEQSIGYALGVLEREGWDRPTLERFTLVEVALRKGTPSLVWNEDGTAAVLRRLPTRSVAGLPEMTKRQDGVPTERDAVQLAEEARVAMWNLARAQSNASAVASDERLAASVALLRVLPHGTPNWVRDGLLGWLSVEIRRGPPPPAPHICGGSSRAPADIAARVLGAQPGRTEADISVFSDVLAAYAQAKTLSKAVEDLVTGLAEEEGERTAAEVFAAAFGATEAELFGAALAEVEEAVDCDAGRLTCPGCDGKKTLELACGSCEGMGRVVCAACRGSPNCLLCRGEGEHSFRGARTVKCGYCSGKGKFHCRPCMGRETADCSLCDKGDVERDCALCEDGTVACPWKSAESAAENVGVIECTWCSEDAVSACSECRGVGYLGCDPCWGTSKVVCRPCFGLGHKFSGSRYSSRLFSEECTACKGEGGTSCTTCKYGKRDCFLCAGEGLVKQSRKGCRMCTGTGLVPAGDVALHRIADRRAPVSSEEGQRVNEMIERARDFLLSCRKSEISGFALRDFREGDEATAGELWPSNVFSNAYVLWVLVSAGVDPEDDRVLHSWNVLRKQLDAELIVPPNERGVQGVAIAMRALAIAGQARDRSRIEAAIEALEEGQVRSGGWSSNLDGAGEAESLSSLIALESLWLAHRSGYKVSRSVWGKGLRVAKKTFTSTGVRGMKKSFVTATEVASHTAMIVMAKSAQLGDDAAGFDYLSMPRVRAGVGWLDRYFAIDDEPSFNVGGVRISSSDAGYSAYLFAIQRLAMLLDIQILAGERWHRSGARHLAELQFPDGSFEERSSSQLNGPVRTTSSVLMFLLRATPSVTQDHRDR